MELPYMKLWTQRFFGSIRVQALRGEHRLIYLGLLVSEWGLDGRGLPNDLAELGRILGISEDVLRDAWGDGTNRISQFFEVRGGRLFNDTLETTISEDKEERRRVVARAKAGARMRWGRKKRKCLGIAQAMPRIDGDGVHQDGDEGADGELVKRPDESFKAFDLRVERRNEARRESARRELEAKARAERQAPIADAVPLEEVQDLLQQVRQKFERDES